VGSRSRAVCHDVLETPEPPPPRDAPPVPPVPPTPPAAVAVADRTADPIVVKSADAAVKTSGAAITKDDLRGFRSLGGTEPQVNLDHRARRTLRVSNRF
jgi:hypothetical protein